MSPKAVPAQGRSRGFTLIELMVVVIIVGLLVTFAVISMGDTAARRLEEETTRFASLLRLAADEAVLNIKDIGLEIDEQSYSFFVFDDQLRTWIPIDDTPTLRTRQMKDGIRMELYMDDLEMELVGKTDPEDEEADPPSPQVLMLSSGEITPFELRFEMENLDKEVLLRALANGEVELLTGDEI